MVRRLAVFVTVFLSIPAAVHAQSVSQTIEPADPFTVSDASLARIRHALTTLPVATKSSILRVGMTGIQQLTAAEWRREFERTTALRRKSNNVMRLGLVLAGVGALSAAATPSAKGAMAVAGAAPGLGIATWGYFARRKGDRELKRLESTRPAGVKTPPAQGKTP